MALGAHCLLSSLGWLPASCYQRCLWGWGLGSVLSGLLIFSHCWGQLLGSRPAVLPAQAPGARLPCGPDEQAPLPSSSHNPWDGYQPGSVPKGTFSLWDVCPASSWTQGCPQTQTLQAFGWHRVCPSLWL